MDSEHNRRSDIDALAMTEGVSQIVTQIKELTDRAYTQYSALVSSVINGQITDIRTIERIMDGLIDFGDDLRFLEIYKDLCRHIYSQYPQLVGEHIALFRLQFEENDDLIDTDKKGHEDE